jgi:carboxymethylenebutenolidase
MREAACMAQRTFDVETPDGTLPIYEAQPDGDARGGVIVIQEAFGVNDHIEDVTRRFASAGYHAMAPHLFHRAGGGTAPYGEFDKVMPLFEGLTDDGILADIDATTAELAKHGVFADRTGIVGFCFGGRVTFLVAARRQLGAAVGFYGGGIVTQRFPQFPPLIDEVSALLTPWLGLFGDLDTSIPVEDVERLRTALDRAGVDHDVVRYPNAEHGFHCDVRSSYAPDAAKDAWQRTLDWFDGRLG